MHDCKCGRSIPKQWKRCGECAERRSLVESMQSRDGVNYDDKVSLRHKVALSLTKMRDTPKQVTASEILSTLRNKNQRAMRQQFAHDNLAPALKRWMEGD